MLRLAAIAIFAILSLISVFLSGAWLGDSARASMVSLTVALLLAVCALALTGCSRIRDGDGFGGGYPDRPLCIDKTRTGERWRDC